MSGLSIEVADEGHELVITVTGDLDIERADGLESVGILAAQSLHGRRLVIDLASVGFVDSTGLNALIQIRHAAEGHGLGVELRSLQPRVRKVFEIAGLLGIFDVAPVDADKPLGAST